MDNVLWSGVEILVAVIHENRIEECQQQASAGAVCSDHTKGEEDTALCSAPCSPITFSSLLEEIACFPSHQFANYICYSSISI